MEEIDEDCHHVEDTVGGSRFLAMEWLRVTRI
jgi:hypothetical protein